MAKKVVVDNLPLTKNRFERLLSKAAQPVAEWKHAREGKETSASHPSDGCSGKRKRQDKTEGKEG